MVDRLTTLQAVKEWLGIETDGSDEVLVRLIEAASVYAYNLMNRNSFAAHEQVEEFYGNGKKSALLKEWPVLSISSVGIEGRGIPAATVGPYGFSSNGYRISLDSSAPQSLDLFGYCYPYRGQVQVVYRAGYEATQDFPIKTEGIGPDEKVIRVTPSDYGCWIVDFGVLINGDEAVKVDSDPGSGQYSVDQWGSYDFSIADKGKTATIHYGYAPWDVSQAICELVSEAYRYKDRIGVKSKSLAGQETVSYFDSIMTPTISRVLGLYQNVAPM